MVRLLSREIGALIVVVCSLLTACNQAARDEAPVVADTATNSAEAIPEPPLAVLDSGAPKLLPFDSASYSFADFRRRLLHALQQHDSLFLYSIVAPEIKNSFGGDDGIAGFKRRWRVSEPDAQIWTVLTRILKLGGRQRGETFNAPYVFAGWPDSIDAFDHVAVTSERAIGRAAPDPTSPAEGILTYSILRVAERHNPGEMGVLAAQSWARLIVPSGRSVWLSGADYYSPVDWRAYFENRAGRWVMTFLVAGD